MKGEVKKAHQRRRYAEYQLSILLAAHGNSRTIIADWLSVPETTISNWCRGHCHPKLRPRSPDEQIEQNTIPEPNTGCLLWIGPTFPFGYGHIKHDGRNLSAHRYMWELRFGAIESRDLFVCHKCDTPQCCNPDHMFLGTAKDNMADMANKGRGARGSNHFAGLPAEKVALIRATKHIPRRDVAAMVGCSVATVSNIRVGNTHAR